jgi:hypothetical protein
MVDHHERLVASFVLSFTHAPSPHVSASFWILNHFKSDRAHARARPAFPPQFLFTVSTTHFFRTGTSCLFDRPNNFSSRTQLDLFLLVGASFPSLYCVVDEKGKRGARPDCLPAQRKGEMRTPCRSSLCVRALALVAVLGSLSWFSFPMNLSAVSTTTTTHVARPQPSSLVNTTATATTTTTRLPSTTDDRLVSPPLHAWQTHVRHHGAAALAQDTPAQRAVRRYIVAPYWCPDRAGNVLHNLWNSLAWAVLLNRTVLLQWVDSNPNGNTRDACAAVMPTRPALALWADWATRLDLHETDVYSIPLDVSRWRYDASLRVVWVPQIADVYHTDPTLYRNEWDHHPLAASQPGYRAYLQDIWRAAAIDDNDDSLPRQAAQLFRWGVPFLYGLFFRHVFVLPPSPLAESTISTSDSGVAIAVHSRHVAAGDDGSWVPEEVACLTEMLSKTTAATPCTVTLLSDRRASLRLLTEWVQTHAPHCRVGLPPDDGVDTTRVREHGPFAGAGFLYDLSRATTGPPLTALVGDLHRSSLALLYELAVYDKFSALPADSNVTIFDPSTVVLPVCALSRKAPSGYSYGPGTPLFVRNQAHFPPLETTQALNDYRTTLATQPVPRFVVVDLACPSQPNYQDFLAALVFAMLSERDLLWRPTLSNPADCRVKDWLSSWDEASSRHNLTLAQAVDFSDPTSPESQLVTVSPPSLETLTSTLLRGTLLRPNQGGGRRKMAEALYTYGPDFLFGMLLQEVFVEVLPRQQVPKLDPTAWTVGLDIRGTPPSEHLPRVCLDLALGNRTNGECQVVILGDAQTSAQSLQKQVEDNYNCSVVEVTDSQPGRAVAVTRQVRHGWISVGAKRDALSSRIRQRIEWERVQETWKLGRFPIEVPPFRDCRSAPSKEDAS